MIKINQISWCGNPIEPVVVNPMHIVRIDTCNTKDKPKTFFTVVLRDGSEIETYDFPDVAVVEERCQYCGNIKGYGNCPHCGANA